MAGTTFCILLTPILGGEYFPLHSTCPLGQLHTACMCPAAAELHVVDFPLALTLALGAPEALLTEIVGWVQQKMP